MRKCTVLSVFLVLSCFVARGQIVTGEDPVSFRSEIPALRSSAITQKAMPELDMEKVMREDREDEEIRLPFRFGYGHEVPRPRYPLTCFIK